MLQQHKPQTTDCVSANHYERLFTILTWRKPYCPARRTNGRQAEHISYLNSDGSSSARAEEDPSEFQNFIFARKSRYRNLKAQAAANFGIRSNRPRLKGAALACLAKRGGGVEIEGTIGIGIFIS